MPGAAKTTRAAIACRKLIDDIKSDLQHGYHHKLCEAVHRVQCVDFFAAIPYRDENFTLVVGVNQADQIAEHNAVFVAKPRARQDDGGKSALQCRRADPVPRRRAWRSAAGFP